MAEIERNVSAPAAWPAGMPYSRLKSGLVRGGALVGMLALGVVVGRVLIPHSGGAAPPTGASGEAAVEYTCSMHPQIKLPRFGQCPICFMDLVPVGSAGADGERGLSLSERARALARIETTAVVRGKAERELRLTGKVAIDETRVAYISAYAPGRLDRLYVNYTGILVRKGDHLAEIYSPQLIVGQREYLVALQGLKQAEDSASQAAIQKAARLIEASRRNLELWGVPKDEVQRLEKSNEPSDRLRIDAPREGWVIDRQGYEGMYTETGMRLFTIADLRTVWVLLDAYELDLGVIHYGQRVEFESEAFAAHKIVGRVAYIDPVLNETTRTVNVRVNVPNPDLHLRPGMFVRARLLARVGAGGAAADNELAGKWISPMHPEIVKDGPGKCDVCGMDLVPAESLGFASREPVEGDPLVIPASAALLTGRRAVVYVETQTSDGPAYEGREVELGPRCGDVYVVLGGLSEGERVVTRGALRVDSAVQIVARPSMMSGETLPARPPPPASVKSHFAAGAAYHGSAAKLVDAYLEWAHQLAEDDEKAARKQLDALRQALDAAAPESLRDEAAATFRDSLARIRKTLPPDAAPAMKGMREALPKVTAEVELFLRAFGHARPAPIYRIHCPMAFDDRGADWLQIDEAVRNPYFGAAMYRCGAATAEIAPDGKLRPSAEAEKK
ncbi:Cation efflux system protein CusB precursor [Phycisphaerae bacterium RAS1]|nr:Cation efflux system protein CusB precursor [Phycisphaerae bacterium RAS1]